MWITSFQSAINSAPVALHIFGKRSAGDTRPVLVYFHGGLFNAGCVEDVYPLATELSTSMVVVCVDYPLAPETHFPDTMEIAFEALSWVYEHAASIGADSKHVLIGGEQAGGNLAAVTAMLFRDRGIRAKRNVKLSGQILINPMLDALQATKSMGQAADCPCRRAWVEYIPLVSQAMHPYASPANSVRLAGLAPTLMITSNADPLRDEAEDYAAKLLLAGVPVQARRLEGLCQLQCGQSQSFTAISRLIKDFMEN